MSKKLIAVAAAAALALSALVVVPAGAAAPSAAISTFTSGAGSAADPYLIPVPAINSIEATTNAATLTLEVSTGDVVRVTSTGTVKFATATLTNTPLVDVTKVAVQDYSSTRTTDDEVLLYVMNTSTTTGTVTATITNSGIVSTNTFSVQGTVAAASKYNIVNVTGVPATLAKGATAAITFEITDSLGNKVESATTFTAANMTTPTWSASDKVYKTTLTSPSSTAFLVSIDIQGAADVAGFADAADVYTGVVNNTGVSDQIASLTAQVAALQVIVDRKVTKKRFNTLARKWNAAFPSQKVKLKK
jgi:hypothetical protein